MATSEPSSSMSEFNIEVSETENTINDISVTLILVPLVIVLTGGYYIFTI